MTNHLCKNVGWIMRVPQKPGTPSWRQRALDELGPLHPCRLAGWFGLESPEAWPTECTLLNTWQPWTSREGQPTLALWQSPLLIFVRLWQLQNERLYRDSVYCHKDHCFMISTKYVLSLKWKEKKKQPNNHTLPGKCLVIYYITESLSHKSLGGKVSVLSL